MSWEAIGGLLGVAAAVYTAVRAASIERLKGDLEIEKSRFSSLYQRRLDVLSELYGRLGAVEVAAQQLMKPLRRAGEETEEESRERFVTTFNDLREYFIRTRLFVPKLAADDTANLIQRIAKSVSDFYWMRDHENRGITGNWPGWDELWLQIKDEIPSVREEIELRFREHLEPQSAPSNRKRVAKWLQSALRRGGE